jgi:hypothetical protein
VLFFEAKEVLMSFTNFMATPMGRLLRGGIGIAMFFLGFTLLVTRGSVFGIVLLLGLIPFVAGICAPFWGVGQTGFPDRNGKDAGARMP